MNCKNCGNPMPKDAKICPYCGEKVQKKKKIAGKILGITAAVLAVVLLAAGIFLMRFLTSPRVTLAKAFGNSIAAWTETARSSGLSDLTGILKTRAFTVTGTLRPESLEVLDGKRSVPLPESLGIRTAVSADFQCGTLSGYSALSLGEKEILSLHACAEGDTVTLYSPQVIGDTAVAVNTVTLGRDLGRLGAPEELQKISFQMPDLVQPFPVLEVTPDAGGVVLLDFVRVEKGKTCQIQLNGSTVSAVPYELEIPEEHIASLLRTWADAIAAETYLSPETEDETLGDRAKQNLLENIRAMQAAVEKNHGLKLECYVKDELVCAVVWQQQDGELLPAEAALRMGGGERYTDDLSLSVRTDDTLLQLSLSGDHSAAGGSYTNHGEISCSGGGEQFRNAWDTFCDFSTGEFRWNMTGSGGEKAVRGTVTLDQKLCRLAFDDFSSENKIGTVHMSGEISLGSYVPMKVQAAQTADLASMEPEDLEILKERAAKTREEQFRKLLKDLFGMPDFG